jgi:hypothetical protein
MSVRSLITYNIFSLQNGIRDLLLVGLSTSVYGVTKYAKTWETQITVKFFSFNINQIIT